MNEIKTNKIGEVKMNNQGCEMRIIEYKDLYNVLVEFKNGYIKECRYRSFKSGSVKNEYHGHICGVGYIGIGKYNSKNNKRAYMTWSGMLERCYGDRDIWKEVYKDCYVSKDWHNFQNFARWYEENYYEIKNERMVLDKDILYKGNKVYSSYTCIFVTSFVNQIFNVRKTKRGKFPIGVYQRSEYKDKYIATIIKYRKTRHIGTFNTPEQAFKAYKIEKEKYIKEVADKYKDQIPQKLYDAMYRYKVKIDD